MPKVLTPSQVEQYHRDGYVHPIRVMSEEKALELRKRLEDYEASSGGPISGDMRQKSHLLFGWLGDLIRNDIICDAVEDLYGPDLLCWASGFFIKEPRNPSFVSWHQDATYWGLNKNDIVTAWIALSPSIVSNGAMKVIPGTHLQEQIPHRDTFDKDNLLTRGQEIAVEVDESEAVAIELQPGEISLHHVLLFHGSEPNTSDTRRVGFAARYIPTSLKQTAADRDYATLVRGIDTYNHFEHEARPTSDLAPEFVALHKKVTGQNAKILYQGTGIKDFNTKP